MNTADRCPVDLEPGTPCLCRPAWPGHAGAEPPALPCVVVRAGAFAVQVEVFAKRRLVRRWVERERLTPDPGRTHALWPAYDARVRAIRACADEGS